MSSLWEPADARPRRRGRAVAAAPAYAPPFAALVVDANTGKVLYSQNPDAHRHPASITKVMTLYMLFEQLEKRRLTLQSEITVSAHAASMPPTKLGLRPGSTITVENAIKAIVTKSANDMAAAVGEAIGGSEDRFAQMMTQKAKSLGMTRTNFENASGLPNPDQVTTAHDLAILGRVMRERFPQYFHYFGATSYQVGRMVLRNHNRLLGHVEGVDGIKTGYTRASGFNLLTSARRGNKRIVAVVLGGPSAGRRDAIMANLVERHIDVASATRTAPALAEREVSAPVEVAEAPKPAPRPEPAVQPPQRPEPPKAEPVRAEPARPLPPPPVQQARREESEQQARPLALAAFAPTQPARPAVISAAPRTGDLVPTASIPNAPAIPDGSTRTRTASLETSPSATGSRTATPSTLRWLSGPSGANPSRQPAARADFVAPPAPVPAAAPVKTASRVTPPAPIKAQPEPEQTTQVAKTRPQVSGVIIQIGATDDAGKARELLDRARSHSGGQLARAKAFTEPVQKGRETLYRARFAGLDEKGAEAACKTLKRSGFGCFATRN